MIALKQKVRKKAPGQGTKKVIQDLGKDQPKKFKFKERTRKDCCIKVKIMENEHKLVL